MGTLLWVLACSAGFSAILPQEFLVKTWTPDEGLPQNVVFTLAQTRDGYLWLGTGNGLARFDGLHFKTFDEEEAPELAGNKILKVFEDSRQNLWIATDNSGVLVVGPRGRVEVVRKADPEEGPLFSICEDAGGNVWFTMAQGQLFRFADGQATLVLQGCQRVMADKSGLVWVAAAGGKLVGLGPLSGAGLSAIPVAYEIMAGKVDFLLASRTGGYWRFAEGRIQKWNKDQLEQDLGVYPWEVQTSQGAGQQSGVPVMAACEDTDGNLMVGTFGRGVYWLDRQGHTIRIAEISNDSIFALATDSEGSLWVGTNGGGLNRVRPKHFRTLQGTLDSTVQSVCSDGNGGLWIGYNAERVDHWTEAGLQSFTNIWPSVLLKPPPGLTPLYVQSVLQDKTGQLWIGGSSSLANGFCFFAFQGGHFLPVSGTPAFRKNVSSIFQGSDSALWVGTEKGLARLDGGVWKLFTASQGLSSDSIRAIAQDREGRMWIGTDRGGLDCLENGHFSIFRKQPTNGLPADNITSLLVDKAGVLWVGTTAGLSRFERGQWRRFTTREGLASNKIGYLIEDDEGYFWIGSSAGLMRILKRYLNELPEGTQATMPCRLFGKSDGLPTGECSSESQPGPCRTADGSLWFPTIKGLVVVKPSSLKPNTNPPPVIIESVLVDGELQGEDRLRSQLPHSVSLPASKQTLEVHFTSLNLAAPESGFFRYRLTPHERDWTQAEPQRRYARYPRLPHGQYRFEVKACNEDGVWNETPAVLSVVVLPPFWRTWWFMTGMSILMLALVAGSVHYVSTQKLQRQLASLRQQEALEQERSRIARDLHDQLGANLTQVTLLAEMAEADKELPQEVESHARQICATARETTHALDEIVWTVNPSNDSLEGLINYVCKYAQDYLALADLKYRIEVPPQLPSAAISPEVRHNVFLAAKESINNVVKHSGAQSAWLRLALERTQFVLEIEDNGRGVQPGDQNKGRNGLRNMRRRMEEIGGSFEISPGAEGGTKIRLTAPFAQKPKAY